MQIGLREWRRFRGLSKEEMAEVMGTTPIQLQRYEDNLATPTLQEFARLVKRLDISARYLLDLLVEEET